VYNLGNVSAFFADFSVVMVLKMVGQTINPKTKNCRTQQGLISRVVSPHNNEVF